ncbi:MAG: diaminopimelate decarboxylase [Bacteroidetes bacterium 4572_77]|nr:MAG: diaminopimelate decarboxylase [Bacteroidetes bacterium 4572_77]
MEKKIFEKPLITKINAGVPEKFGMQNQLKPITHIDKVAVKDIIKDYGSPVFVVSEQIMEETYESAMQAFSSRYPKVQFAWSYKTNYLNAVCRKYHQLGSWAEVVSGFEYHKALSNGVEGSKIIFNGPDKSDEDLKLAIDNKSLIHIDHFEELYSILRIADTCNNRPKVAIRVNMDTGIYPMWDRFGFNYENGDAWNAINRLMISDKVDFMGLHTHIGTYIMAAWAYGNAAKKLAELAVRIEKKFHHHIKYIDMGGGFASKNTLKGAFLPGADTCPSFDDFAESITNALISSDLNPDFMPSLFLETGRALIDDAGYLLGSVIGNKRLSSGRASTILDIGVNILFTSFWYEHLVYPGENTTHYTEDTTLYGPLCMNIDVIRDSILFPSMKKGQHVVIKRIGAYNMTQWMQFITHRPAIVMIDKQGETHLIRKRETNESITREEQIPDYLK